MTPNGEHKKWSSRVKMLTPRHLYENYERYRKQTQGKKISDQGPDKLNEELESTKELVGELILRAPTLSLMIKNLVSAPPDMERKDGRLLQLLCLSKAQTQ